MGEEEEEEEVVVVEGVLLLTVQVVGLVVVVEEEGAEVCLVKLVDGVLLVKVVEGVLLVTVVEGVLLVTVVEGVLLVKVVEGVVLVKVVEGVVLVKVVEGVVLVTVVEKGGEGVCLREEEMVFGAAIGLVEVKGVLLLVGVVGLVLVGGDVDLEVKTVDLVLGGGWEVGEGFAVVVVDVVSSVGLVTRGVVDLSLSLLEVGVATEGGEAGEGKAGEVGEREGGATAPVGDCASAELLSLLLSIALTLCFFFCKSQKLVE